MSFIRDDDDAWLVAGMLLGLGLAILWLRLLKVLP